MARLEELYEENKREIDKEVRYLSKLIDEREGLVKEYNKTIERIERLRHKREKLHIPFEEDLDK